MRPHRTYALLCLTISLAVGCSSGGPRAGGAQSSSVLTQQDLEAVANLSAYEAVERLRPAWLRIRGTTSVVFAGDQLPSAMVDDTHTDLSVLRGLRTGNLREMRFIDGRDATTRYGTGYVNGIIQVFTRRGP